MSALFAVSLLGGLLAVEQRAELRLMVSQPVCGGILTGIALGAVGEGFFAGAMLQILFLGFVPLRGEEKPDLPLAGVATAASYILSMRRLGGGAGMEGIILFGSLLLGLLIALLGSIVYRRWERKISWALFESARDAALKGRTRIAKTIHLSTLLLHLLYGFFVLLALIPAGTALIALAARAVGTGWGGSVSALQYIVPFVGVGSLSRLYFSRSRAFWFGTGFLVTYLLFLVR